MQTSIVFGTKFRRRAKVSGGGGGGGRGVLWKKARLETVLYDHQIV